MARIALPDPPASLSDQPDIVRALMLRPKLAVAVSAMNDAVVASALDWRLHEILRMRVALINGCATCLAWRTPEAIAAGVTEQLLAAVADWRTSGEFTDAERVALTYTELFCGDSLAITDDLLSELEQHFDAGEIVDLTLVIGKYLSQGRFMQVLGLDQNCAVPPIPNGRSLMSDRTYRVVQWSTGHVGKHALAGIDARPDLELVGLFVSNPNKVGKDAGELASLGKSLGVAGTSDAQALLDLKPDCIVHTAWADDRLDEALADLARFLRAGINVVSSSPVFLQYPYGVADDMAKDVIAAAHEGGASIFVNGVDPGFGNDALPLVITGISERIEQVRCMELLNYATYDQASVLADIMGFGTPMDTTPFILLPGILTMAWGSVVHQLGAGLGVEFDSVQENYERFPAPEDFDIPTGTIKKGTQAALRFEVRGVVNGKDVIVLEHVTRLRDDLAPDWPQPAGQGCYRVVVTGEPMYTVDMQLLGTDGDHNTAGLKATAMRLVNALPHVVAADPGLVTALDLPLITGRGLVRT